MLGIVRDITKRRRAEMARLSHAKEQRDALVQEVHHRIKNNLQGVVGLLRQHATKFPVVSKPLEGAISQVNSMALVHGLMGRAEDDGIILHEMIDAICDTARSLTGEKTELHITFNHEQPVQVTKEESVPIALALNELIFNAIKHHGQNPQPVQIILDSEAGTARVSIINPDTRLPSGFDFSTGQGLGTGLNLVKSLLPDAGCQLHFSDDAIDVITELQLKPPIIIPCQIL